MLDVADFGTNPHAPEFGEHGVTAVVIAGGFAIVPLFILAGVITKGRNDDRTQRRTIPWRRTESRRTE
jgi:hypothetical protein